MKQLEKKILLDGRVIDNKILKVDDFLNWKIEPKTINEIADYFVSCFDTKIDKVLTIETSGIAIAMVMALKLNVPMIFAKKHLSLVMNNDEVYTSKVYSFTHDTEYNIVVNKRFIQPKDKVLIVDDFLAKGGASIGLVDLIKKAKAKVVGVAVEVEKDFQGGRELLEKQGIKVVSAARIEGFKNGKPLFYKEMNK